MQSVYLSFFYLFTRRLSLFFLKNSCFKRTCCFSCNNLWATRNCRHPTFETHCWYIVGNLIIFFHKLFRQVIHKISCIYVFHFLEMDRRDESCRYGYWLQAFSSNHAAFQWTCSAWMENENRQVSIFTIVCIHTCLLFFLIFCIWYLCFFFICSYRMNFYDKSTSF